MKPHPVDLVDQERSRRKAEDYGLEYEVKRIAQVVAKLAAVGVMGPDG
jgi:hypothetical protein